VGMCLESGGRMLDAFAQQHISGLAPDFVRLLDEIVPDDMVLLRFEDRWDTFEKSPWIRTWTFDFARGTRERELPEFLLTGVERAVGQGFRVTGEEDDRHRTSLERERTQLRIWPANALTLLGIIPVVRSDIFESELPGVPAHKLQFTRHMTAAREK